MPSERHSLGGSCNEILPGQYSDTESGLNYNYLRDYDPPTGRYVESDPIGLKGGSVT
jgi:RHS repeat-associated protein